MAKAANKHTRPTKRKTKIAGTMAAIEGADTVAVTGGVGGITGTMAAIEGHRPAKLTTGGRKLREAQSAIGKVYPDGVPDEISTKTVQQEIKAKLGREMSWDTVHRALGRALGRKR